MPELPEVQTIVNDLNQENIVGRTITAARIYWPKIIAEPSARVFGRRLAGRVINTIRRRGKFIIFDLSGGEHLLIHLRMTGHLHLVPAQVKRSKHEHLILCLDEKQHLRFHDTRKFGRCRLVRDLQTVLGVLGPEPLEAEFSVSVFRGILRGHRRLLKPFLLDQTLIAGLGNIYVDEALWEARLHPRRLSSSLTDLEIGRLHKAVQKVLIRGLQNQGTSLGLAEANFSSLRKKRGRNQRSLQVFRRIHEPCPRCGNMIRRILVGQRGTHYCQKCQRL